MDIAFFRVLFAGLALLPLLRRGDVAFRPAMIGMAISFAVMNALYISAQAWGSAANAVLLQYTAPLWMYLGSVFFLREPAERRSSIALAFGLGGVLIIVLGGPTAQLPVVGIALGSGVAYAGVIFCLRVLRGQSSRWLTVVNHLFSAAALLPFMMARAHAMPTARQLAILVLFGTTQMALPYWLVARGLRAVSPQEAGTITLLEPLLNPVWAFLVSPETETPPPATWAGGACILGGLLWRYWPRRRSA
jgi:drug/metabolite transporter (DMT)-like permease